MLRRLRIQAKMHWIRNTALKTPQTCGAAVQCSRYGYSTVVDGYHILQECVCALHLSPSGGPLHGTQVGQHQNMKCT